MRALKMAAVAKAVVVSAAVLLPQFAAAETPAPATPASVHQYQSLALSAKGDFVAAVEGDDPRDSYADLRGVVVVRNRITGAVLQRFDPCNICFYSGLIWSPEGAALAFVGIDRKTRTSHLYTVENGKLGVPIDFQGLMQTPRWSPDGKTLAVLAIDHPGKEPGATHAGAARVGQIGAAVDEQRIAVVPAAGGALRMVSPADTFVYEYDWQPDGLGFVASEAKGDGDNNWWVAKLAAVRLSDGALTQLAAPDVQIRYPRVTPDGKSVAFIGGLMSDFGPTGGDLYTVPLDAASSTGGVTNRTPGFKGSLSSLISRGRTLLATAVIGDQNVLMSVDPANGATKTLLSTPKSIAAGDARLAVSANGGIVAGVMDDYTTPPAIVAGAVASAHAITHDNDTLTGLVSARSIGWKNEGFDVQGYLIAPKDVSPGKTYPMVVQIHGGPSSVVQPGYLWKGTVWDLVSHGYYVFLPNPRGSFGQGEAFTRANIKDFGGGDLRDIVKGIDAVEAVAPVDDKRLGVMGGSYGGYMTMWTVTHSQRFKAAVAGAGISDWVAYYGQNGIDQWMIPFFGASAYDDPAVYDRLSPIRYIKAAKTPTFIYVGERDVECPAAQSLEFWHGLEAMGVPSSLMIYEGEGHAIRDGAHRDDLRQRTLEWLDKYLGNAASKSGS